MDIHESIDRILEAEEIVGGHFYETFLSRYTEVQKYFRGVNLNRQAVMLTMALLVIEQYEGSSYPILGRYLRELGEKHAKLGIPAETYPQFCDALLDTLESFHGDDWDEALANQWATAIDRTVEQMLKGYEKPARS